MEPMWNTGKNLASRGFKSQPRHLLALSPWANCSVSEFLFPYVSCDLTCKVAVTATDAAGEQKFSIH